jgi:hypothetical protein
MTFARSKEDIRDIAVLAVSEANVELSEKKI